MSIKIIKESLIVGLNSIDANKLNNSKLSNVLFDFKGLIRHSHNYKNLKVQVLDAVIPHSFYNIDESNNLLVINGQNLLIKSGNYSQFSLFIELKRILPQSIVASFIKVSGKISFASTGYFILNKEGTVLQTLGFEKADYTPLGNILLAPYPLYLAGNKILKITSKALSCNNHDSFNNNNNHLLTFVTVNSPPHSLIYYKNLSQLHYPMKENYINEIDIQIYDEFNKFIDFNNTSWNIILSITYEKEIFIDDVTFEDIKRVQDISVINGNNLKVFPKGEKSLQSQPESLGNKNKKDEPPLPPPTLEEPENISTSTNETDLDILLYNNHLYH